LYRKENLYGQQLINLAVPKSRLCQYYSLRITVVILQGSAHMNALLCRVSRGALAQAKTVCSGAIEYAANCPTCQLHARTTCFDSVPIQAVPREPSIFRHLQMHIFGPIVPNDRLKFNYALLVICVATCYPWAFTLRTATAKIICDALLKIMEVTGIARDRCNQR
jgi:hypothetical protein